MFLTSIVMKIKNIWEFLVYPSKYYSKKYSKKYAREYSVARYDISVSDS